MEYVIIIALVLFSGLFSGLTLGLLSLDVQELERKMSLGDERARTVHAVRKKGNLLLSTLLLGNVAVNSTLAVFLSEIASGVIAGIVSTALIVVFGEIIPQASISRYALEVGAKTAWIVRIFMFVLSPICRPIAWALDKALGDEMPTIYSKRELVKIVSEHEGSQRSTIDQDEYRIVHGALSFSDMTAKSVMTPRTVVFGLSTDELLDEDCIAKIKSKGFTRVPVFGESVDNIIGILYAKDLLGQVTSQKAGEACRKDGWLSVSETVNLDATLNSMLISKNHLAIVKDEYGGFSGIITMEDIMEEILNTQIMDETDQIEDLRQFARETGQQAQS